MRALFLCDLPRPLNSGAHQRLRHLLKGVASAAEVTLVYPTVGRSTTPDLEALGTFCKHVYTFPLESLANEKDYRLPKTLYWAKHKLRYLHPVTPAFMQRLRSKEANALVAKLCSQRFDLIWGQRISSMQMLPAAVPSRVIIDLDDLEHRSLQSRLLLGKSPPHMIPLEWFEFLKLRRMELSLRKFPYEFVVCSEIDRELIGADMKVWVIPNGIDLPVEPEGTQENSSDPILMLVGYMAYEPNADGAMFFTRRVLPLIQREVPDVRFLIVGADPTPPVRALSDGKTVRVTGTVPDVREYLRSASVVVVPIRFGGGTRIKILEALAHHKAVVSTSKGAEGLDIQSGKHLLLADSPQDLAEACKRLLKDRNLRTRLGDEGYRVVRDHYQWGRIEKAIEDIIRSRVQVPGAAG